MLFRNRSDWIQAFRILPTLKILEVCDCYTGGMRFEMFDCCPSFENTLVIWKSSETESESAADALDGLPNSLYIINVEIFRITFIILQGPLNSLRYKNFDTHELFEFSFESPWKPLFICYCFVHCFYFRIISVSGPSQSCDTKGKCHVRISRAGFSLVSGSNAVKSCTVFNWLFRYN